MVIGGLEKLSLIDFPGQLSAIIFTKSCNFRCHYCYNPMLVLTNGEGENEDREEDYSQVPEKDLLLFLEERKSKLGGVVISGGEPTLQPDLKDFIVKIRKMGFKIKLDTNGTKPETVEDLINNKLIDYVAMDIKAPLDKYEEVVGVKVDLKNIKNSIKLLKKNLIPYEFRTTLVPGLHELNDIIKISEEIAGAKRWFLQRFKSDTDLVNSKFKGLGAFKIKEIETVLEKARKNVPNCEIRE